MKSSRALATVLSCLLALGLLGAPPATAAARFVDVPAGHTFASEIAWLAEQNISTGYTEPNGSRSFRPSAPILREQMAAFLYRLAGEPEVSQVHMPYADVPANHPFRKAIAWMSTLRITTGYTEPSGVLTFRPGQPVLREQMAAFMYRLAAKPDQADLPATSPFVDVATDHAFFGAIVWLADAAISTGYDEAGGTKGYRGSQPVLREQMAAFLFRFSDLLEREGDFDVSLTSVGADGDISRSGSDNPQVSADGRYVAYTTDSDRPRGDGHSWPGVFLKDRATGEVVEAPNEFAPGTPFHGLVFGSVTGGVISDDGSTVLLTGSASNSIGPESLGLVWDTGTGALEVIPNNARGQWVSSDGRLVVVNEYVPSFGRSRLAEWDRVTGAFTYPIVAADGGDPDGWAQEVDVSPNGRYMAFTSTSTNLVAGVPGGGSRVFVRDRDAAGGPSIRQVSIVAEGTDPEGVADRHPRVANDGTVVYESRLPAPEIGDTTFQPDVRSWDPASGETSLISIDSGATAGQGWSEQPSISADGRYIAFRSWSKALTGIDDRYMIVVWDTQDGRLDVVSRDYWGGVPDAGAESPSISSDGSTVVFASGATDLVPFELFGMLDVYAWDRL